MYSRYHDRSERPIPLPENYGGCAFSGRESPTDTVDTSPRRRVEVARPTPYTDARKKETDFDRGCAEMPQNLPVTPVEDCDADEREAEKEKPVGALLSPYGGLLGGIGRSFPFSHGMGFDEILILGLILLLSREEQGSDLILWLALLLFCG